MATGNDLSLDDDDDDDVRDEGQTGDIDICDHKAEDLIEQQSLSQSESFVTVPTHQCKCDNVTEPLALSSNVDIGDKIVLQTIVELDRNVIMDLPSVTNECSPANSSTS